MTNRFAELGRSAFTIVAALTVAVAMVSAAIPVTPIA